MTISLAIPTYNSSQYFWDCIKPAIHNDFIGEIVIHDDYSSQSEYANILEIVYNLNTNKIKVYRSEKNQKAYINKYLSISKCTNDWVYLFDSDNWFDESIIDVISKLDYNKTNICYLIDQLNVTDGNIIVFDYEDKVLNLRIIKEYIEKKIHHIDWVLNTGNFICNKNAYLNSQKPAVDSFLSNDGKFNNPKGCDVLLFSYYWLMSNNSFEIVDGFYHNHRIRPGNYFVEELYENMKMVGEYLDKILLL
jgi:hypothetical protein